MKLNIFFNQDGELISKEKISSLIDYVLNHPKVLGASKVALSLKVPHEFFAAFLALNELGKEIILLPNYLANTKDEFKDEYDYCLDEVYEKSVCDIDCHLNEDLKITFFTSGSTGVPKKISKKLKNLMHEVKVLESQFGGDLASSHIVSTVSQQHIYGLLFRILWPFMSSRKVSDFNIEYPEELNKVLSKLSQVSLVSSPAFLKRFDLKIDQKLNCLFSSGGDLENAISLDLEERLGIKPFEIFGSTETGGIAFRKGEKKWSFFEGVRGEVDLRNCLKVYSPFIPEGYFQTSDEVKLLGNQFELIGRVDRIIKIEEKRVSLIEIENKLKEHDDVIDCRCLVLSQKNRKIIACVIALNPDSEITKLIRLEQTQYFRNYLFSYFEKIVVPKRFRFIKELPYNEQSKLNIKEMIEYFNE